MERSKKPQRAKRWSLYPLDVVKTSLWTMLRTHPQVFKSDAPKLSGWLRSGDWGRLLSWADACFVNPQAEQEVDESFLVRRQFIALVKKFEFTPEESGLDPEGAAIATFRKAELRCSRINKRFSLLRRRGSAYAPVMDIARRYIERTIGRTPDLQAIYANCDFGGGASIGVGGKATNLGRKLLAEGWSVTPSALPYAKAALWSNDQIALLFSETRNGVACLDYEAFSSFIDGQVKSSVVQHNNLDFVPKTAKTHRTIAVEPLLNGFLQKGVDVVLRQKLIARGIDLSDQARNQELARLGSLDLTDPYVTLDLSAASDSISLELVRELLPPDWFSLLDRLRSPSYSLDGEVHRYHKFCSMGNGFCFPLETLLFAAICHAAYCMCHQKPDLLVYGDDIIVRQNIALYVVELLKHAGFKLNLDKSFFFGDFRESCGADWVRGRDITPVYMRKRVTSLTGLINLHNSLYVNVFKRHRVFPELTQALRELVPEPIRYVELNQVSHDGFTAVGRCTKQGFSYQIRKTPSTSRPWNTGFLVELDEFMASPLTRWDAPTQRWVGVGLFTTPAPDESLVHPLRNGVEYLAVLRGSSSSQPLSLRRETKSRTGYPADAALSRVAQGDRRSVAR